MDEFQTILDELQETWDYTSEEMNDISEKMKTFVISCLCDSVVRESFLLHHIENALE
jgi:hypothetical protein